jgi:hypothetical protein
MNTAIKPDRFTPDWSDPTMPLLRYRVPTDTAYERLCIMQSVIDAMLPLTVSQPVAVVYTRYPESETHWTFTGIPAHDVIRAKVETVTETVYRAVMGIGQDTN